MKLRILARFLSLIIAVISVSMLFPLAWAIKDGSADVRSFVISIAIGAVFGGVLYLLGKGADPKDMGAREAFAAFAQKRKPDFSKC